MICLKHADIWSNINLEANQKWLVSGPFVNKALKNLSFVVPDPSIEFLCCAVRRLVDDTVDFRRFA
jgi:hypothetical protein